MGLIHISGLLWVLILQNSLILCRSLSYSYFFLSFFHCETVSDMTWTSFCLAQHSRHKLQLQQLVGTWSSEQNNGSIPSIEGLSRNPLRAFAQVEPGTWYRCFCSALSTWKPPKKQVVVIIFPGFIFRFIILFPHKQSPVFLRFQTIDCFTSKASWWTFLLNLFLIGVFTLRHCNT